MSKSNYNPVSSALLYVGMTIPHDIYDYGLKRVLAYRGSVVDDELIGQLRALNKKTVYVTAETEAIMRGHEHLSEADLSMRVLEDKSGYGEVKHEVLDMLEKISHADISAVPQKEIGSVSHVLTQTVENTEPSVILELINALAPVDEYLQRHCVNVSLLNGLFGKWLNLSQDEVEMLVLTGLLHDCGKASLPSKILSSPNSLTGIEFQVVRMHPIYSYELLSEFPMEVRQAARGHHEKMNGTGYPDGLSGGDIPFMSRITAIADIYDALTARRSYKDPQSPYSALEILIGLKGDELDSELVDIFANKTAKTPPSLE